MTTLQSYACGQWNAGSGDPKALHDPSTAAERSTIERRYHELQQFVAGA